MPKSARPLRSDSSAAAQPMTGGSAPGIAPMTVANDVRRFSGV